MENKVVFYVGAGSKIVESSGAVAKPTEETGVTKASLLAESTWAKNNLLEDINYLTAKKDSHTDSDATKERARKEPTSQSSRLAGFMAIEKGRL